ncbi:hypothetical protein NA57DRAFT_75345 [Rhizodiscina lignyota]|uniref:Uncharacterized protein n=1 Tax=Rhizodiscina lignyota TaxID=1504668 RepID=A0A9P4IKI6_9PEZI|nr:hypothetical protein NA57DRAFT_75345 [Rhizodiscina lignyota]
MSGRAQHNSGSYVPIRLQQSASPNSRSNPSSDNNYQNLSGRYTVMQRCESVLVANGTVHGDSANLSPMNNLRSGGTTRSYSPPPPNFITVWGWELFTWTLGTAALFAIIAILKVFDGKPTAQWRFVIELTTVVSILTQVVTPALLVSVQSCLGQLKWVWFQRDRPLDELEVFDEASRGPEGSVKLLWKMAWRIKNLKMLGYLLLPYLGALITLFMLGFQPFVQQSIMSDGSRWITSNADTHINRTFTFKIPDQFENLDPYLNDVDGNERGQFFGIPIEAAINDGLAKTNNKLSQVSGVCPTHNCTFEAYTSLAFCAVIEDVTSDITADCSTAIKSALDEANPNVGCTFSVDNATISKPTFFNYTCDNAPDGVNLGAPETMIVSAVPHDSFDASGTTLLDILVIYEANDTLTQVKNDKSRKATCDQASLGALKGSLSLCVQKFATQVINGSTTTIVVDTYNNLNWTNSTGKPDDDWVAQIPGTGPNFTTNGITLSSLGNYLSFWAFNGSADLDYVNGGDNYINWGPGQYLATDLMGVNYTLQGRAQSFRNFKVRLENIATAMTNAIRTQTDNGGTVPMTGHAWTTEPYKRIQYIWLTEPMAVWALTTMLLIITMHVTRHRRVPLWKNSPLALLGRDLLKEANYLEELKREAKTTMVHLGQEMGNGPRRRLEKVDDDVFV